MDDLSSAEARDRITKMVLCCRINNQILDTAGGLYIDKDDFDVSAGGQDAGLDRGRHVINALHGQRKMLTACLYHDKYISGSECLESCEGLRSSWFAKSDTLPSFAAGAPIRPCKMLRCDELAEFGKVLPKLAEGPTKLLKSDCWTAQLASSRI